MFDDLTGNVDLSKLPLLYQFAWCFFKGEIVEEGRLTSQCFVTFLFLFLLCHKKSLLRQFCRFIFLSERLGLCAAGMLDSIGFPMEKSFVGKVESQNIVFKFSAFGESVSNLGICDFQLLGFLLNKSESFSCSPTRFQLSNKSF